MSIDVRSPHDGQLVKVRREDVGRAVRDSAGRVFYVVAKSDDEGYYGSVTRTGNPGDEQRARRWGVNPPTLQEDEMVSVAHDATGRARRGSWRGRFVIGVLVLIVALLVYLFGFGPFANRWTPSPAPTLEEQLKQRAQAAPTAPTESPGVDTPQNSGR